MGVDCSSWGLLHRVCTQQRGVHECCSLRRMRTERTRPNRRMSARRPLRFHARELLVDRMNALAMRKWLEPEKLLTQAAKCKLYAFLAVVRAETDQVVSSQQYRPGRRSCNVASYAHVTSGCDICDALIFLSAKQYCVIPEPS